VECGSDGEAFAKAFGADLFGELLLAAEGE
jgi:hypothetical protein